MRIKPNYKKLWEESERAYHKALDAYYESEDRTAMEWNKKIELNRKLYKLKIANSLLLIAILILIIMFWIK